MGDLGMQVFICSSVRSSICQHLPWVSCELQLQFCTNLFETLHVFLSWYSVWGCACGLDITVRLFFLSLFPLCELSHVLNPMYRQWVLVSPTPHTILYRSFWNFAHVFFMVWRYAYGLDIIFTLIFVTFSTLRTLSFPDLRFYESV